MNECSGKSEARPEILLKSEKTMFFKKSVPSLDTLRKSPLVLYVCAILPFLFPFPVCMRSRLKAFSLYVLDGQTIFLSALFGKTTSYRPHKISASGDENIVLQRKGKGSVVVWENGLL